VATNRRVQHKIRKPDLRKLEREEQVILESCAGGKGGDDKDVKKRADKRSLN